MKFSPSTGCFYPEDLGYQHLPDDLVTISQTDFNSAMARPAGSTLTVEDGQLVIMPAPIPTAAELLVQAQAAQCANIDAACAAAITAGFQSAALGADYTYPSKLTDQTNLQANVLASLMPDLPQDWTCPQICADQQGSWAQRPHTAAQIQQVGLDGKAAIQTCLNKNATLQAQISAASSVAAVEAIQW